MLLPPASDFTGNDRTEGQKKAFINTLRDDYLAKLFGVDGELLQQDNAVIGGDFGTNPWQRGTSFTSVTNGVYVADRFVWQQGGAVVVDISRSTDAPSVAEAGRLITHSLKIDVTTADTSIASSDNAYIQTKIKGRNWVRLAQRETVLVFWVRATKIGTYCASLRNSAADRSCVKEFVINAVDTWEEKTLVFPASPSAGTWDYGGGIGVHLAICLMSGSDFQGAADTWNSANDIATANQVNGVDSASNNFFIADVRFGVGGVNTGFKQPTAEEVFKACRHYHLHFKPAAGGAAAAMGLVYSTTQVYVQFFFEPPMRAAPTLAAFTVGNLGVRAANATHVVLTGLTVQSSRPEWVQLDATVASGLVAGNSTVLIDNAGSGEMSLTAEL